MVLLPILKLLSLFIFYKWREIFHSDPTLTKYKEKITQKIGHLNRNIWSHWITVRWSEVNLVVFVFYCHMTISMSPFNQRDNFKFPTSNICPMLLSYASWTWLLVKKKRWSSTDTNWLSVTLVKRKTNFRSVFKRDDQCILRSKPLRDQSLISLTLSATENEDKRQCIFPPREKKNWDFGPFTLKYCHHAVRLLCFACITSCGWKIVISSCLTRIRLW